MQEEMQERRWQQMRHVRIELQLRQMLGDAAE
jgi:hypothetical protein